MSMEDAAVSAIAEGIIKKLVERSKKLLLVYTGSPAGVDKINEGLVRMKEEGYTFSVYATRAAKEILDITDICRCLNAEDMSGASARDFLSKGTAVLVPSMTRSTAVRLAVGLTDTVAMNILFRAVSSGYEVVASTEGCCPDSPSEIAAGLDRMPPALANTMRSHLEKLESYGIRLVQPDNFCDQVRDAARLRFVRREKYIPPVTVPDPSLTARSSFLRNNEESMGKGGTVRKVLTLSDLVGTEKGSVVEIPYDAVLTPSAREYIRDFGLEIVRKS